MPIRLTIGIAKKLGLPRYSSVGASCDVEVEVPHDLLDQGTESFHEHVRYLYQACRQAVEEELTLYQADGEGNCQAVTCLEEPSGNGRGDAKGHMQDSSLPDCRGQDSQSEDSQSQDNPACHGGCHAPRPAEQAASPRQLAYARTLAQRVGRLGEDRLEVLSQRVCGRSLAGLSRRDASMLIGTLEEALDGQIDLEILLGRDGH